jgi:hypothetical protein
MNFAQFNGDFALKPKATLIICISIILSLANASANEPSQALDKTSLKLESGDNKLPTTSKTAIDDFSKDYPSERSGAPQVSKDCPKDAIAKKRSVVNDRMDLATREQGDRESLNNEFVPLKGEPSLIEQANIVSDEDSIGTRYISPSKKADIKIDINQTADDEC